MGLNGFNLVWLYKPTAHTTHQAPIMAITIPVAFLAGYRYVPALQRMEVVITTITTVTMVHITPHGLGLA